MKINEMNTALLQLCEKYAVAPAGTMVSSPAGTIGTAAELKMNDETSFLFAPSWSRMEERLPVPGPGWEVFPKRMEVNLTITGEKGTIVCDCFGPNVYHNGAPNDRFTVQYTYFDEWIGLIDEFVACIREHKQPTINLRWHRQTIDCMNACYKSVESKLPAKV